MPTPNQTTTLLKVVIHLEQQLASAAADTQKLPPHKLISLGSFQLVGLPSLPAILRQGILKKAISQRISLESLQELPQKINDPIAVFKSSFDPEKRRVVLTELKAQDGGPICCGH